MEDIEIPTDKEINIDFDIHDESVFTLNRELKEFSKLEARYGGWLAKATKKLNDAILNLEIVTAEVTQEICDKEKIPPTGRSEIRRSRIALDVRYRRAKKEVNKAQENKDYMESVVRAWSSRGYRLKEIANLADRLLLAEPRTYGKTSSSPNRDLGDSLDME